MFLNFRIAWFIYLKISFNHHIANPFLYKKIIFGPFHVWWIFPPRKNSKEDLNINLQIINGFAKCRLKLVFEYKK